MMKTKHFIPLFVLIAAVLGAGGSAFSADDQVPDMPPPEGSTAAMEQAAEIPERPAGEGTTASEAQTPDHSTTAGHGDENNSAHGHGGATEHHDWHFGGMFGSYDRAALQRGLKVYREVCAACHSLSRVHFRNLTELGYDEGQVKNIASQYTVIDGPNDEGEMFERPGLPSDHFVPPYPNDNAAKAVNNGALPPDLSLITKARHHGPDHVYGVLTSFGPAPEGVIPGEGQYWNNQMQSLISMAPPLQDGQVAYEDDAPQTVDQYSRDVVEFLAWAADPYLEERKRTGIKVLIFLAVFAGIMYAVKRKIWADLH